MAAWLPAQPRRTRLLSSLFCSHHSYPERLPQKLLRQVDELKQKNEEVAKQLKHAEAARREQAAAAAKAHDQVGAPRCLLWLRP